MKTAHLVAALANQPIQPIHRGDAGRAADYGRLLAQIADYIGNVWQDQDHTALRIREFLEPAGIHPGQIDADGMPVEPPHDDDCRWCVTP